MDRIAVIGNAAGGKSTLARTIAGHRGLRLIEIDRILWQPGWKLTPAEEYALKHDGIVAEDAWLIDGLGRQDSIPARLARATEIVLIDLPLWLHFSLAAERQLLWAQGKFANAPAGSDVPPPTRAFFQTIWDVEQNWMPEIRRLCSLAERGGKKLVRLKSIEDLDGFAQSA